MTFGAAVALAVLYKHRSYAPLYALKLQFVYCWALLFCNALFVFCALFEDSNFTQGLFLLFLGAPIVVIAAAKSRALDPSVEEMAQPEIHDPANTCSTLSLSTVQNLIYLIQTKGISSRLEH
ncbi:MAG: hypothetical protein P4M11_15600 [Candidatus Pacebacteria bacterium]|nr:hypothetical protein [Candidatus Paceibacterota bacterium]